MILRELSLCLDKIFNKNLALSWDKVGLQVGNLDNDVKRILVTLNVTSDVVDEATTLNSELILTHHPLIFNPIDTILSSRIGEKEILKLIKSNVAVYCAHTNYDLMAGGLNDLTASTLGLVDVGIIEEQYGQWYKFVVFVPEESEEKLRSVICQNGGGRWRNYSCCTFNIEGKGTFMPQSGSKPYTGKVGSINYVNEVRIECIVRDKDLNNLIEAVIKAHPYEEVAYDVYKIENKFKEVGVGRLGKLPEKKPFKIFTEEIMKKFEIDGFRWLGKNVKNLENKRISKVAVVCGSANSLTTRLVDIDCDVVVVGEIGYHNALQIVESGKIIIAVGHGNSEKMAVNGMSQKLENFFKDNETKINILKSKSRCICWEYKIG